MTLRVIARLLIACALIGLACAANAQSDVYSCRDANGMPLTGQSPDGCVGEICRTNPVTRARSCTPPPETPEQRAHREETEKRLRECAKIAQDQLRDDLRFLDKYWSDDIIEAERNRAVAEQQLHINDARDRLEALHARQKALASEAEFHGEKHPMPEQLRNAIESNRTLVDAQQLVTVSLENGMKHLNEKYDAMRQRRRDFVQKGSTPAPCDIGVSQ